jgi:hypothetical protein
MNIPAINETFCSKAKDKKKRVTSERQKNFKASERAFQIYHHLSYSQNHPSST